MNIYLSLILRIKRKKCVWTRKRGRKRVDPFKLKGRPSRNNRRDAKKETLNYLLFKSITADGGKDHLG